MLVSPFTFYRGSAAVMAADLALEGSSGRMVALRGGTYSNVPISLTREGVKRVDVDRFYDVDDGAVLIDDHRVDSGIGIRHAELQDRFKFIFIF